MKCSATGEFCLLYVEPLDDKASMFKFVGEQEKPVVIMLAGQSRSRVFQRPEDFTDLKHVKRLLPVPIIFVIAESERLTHLASRNGFPVYGSIDALSEAVARGHLSLSRQRTLTRTVPLNAPEHVTPARKTVPLAPLAPEAFQQRVLKNPSPLDAPEQAVYSRKTAPLTPLPQSAVQQNAFTVKHSSTPLSTPLPQPVAQKRRRSLPTMLVILSLLVLGGAGLGSFLVLFHKLPTVNGATGGTLDQVVGRVYFLSSEQVSENSNQGIDDEVMMDLHNLANPAPGKSYYAWLLGDKNQAEAQSVYLGKLSPDNGSVHLLYMGDQQHTNLLAIASRFLVTEEDAAIPPIAPSPDYSTWRYYGEFSQTGDPMDIHHYSYLDHVRHLLASDPMLNDMELPGGLNNWLFRNTNKLVEWTVSTRDRWEESKDFGFVRRQTMRALAYLDGTSFVQQDLPPNTALPIGTNLAAVGLISVNGSNQNPASYLDSIIFHLDGLLNSPGATPELRKSVAQVIAAMSSVRSWLETLRGDAKQILAMTDAQMSQPAALTLLNEMVDMANNAYAGQIDPATGEMREGVLWIHNHMQSLATFEVAHYTASNQTPEMIPSTNKSMISITSLKHEVRI
jgi:hypothetical protein